MCLTAGKSNGFIFHLMFQFFETKQIGNSIFHKLSLIFQCIFTAGKSNMRAIRVSFKVFDTWDVGNIDFPYVFILQAEDAARGGVLTSLPKDLSGFGRKIGMFQNELRGAPREDSFHVL